ncbi:hypothetical protein M413DRAFT_445054 [Hebeloma cylindrosporum]|uniref:Uncharacterized protein n=1 Tax=Hebeloma cylindrosporum TaxID=76867 RepID=A0A0C3BZ29_HEBCY|nr:hypothetical protein M413DRAFT_445054 [Hebeloma cylindrosporum h7]
MAAIYLHNALSARNPSEQHDILEHSRNLSTISSATLLTSTTLHSQPTEPLLQPAVPEEVAESYFDQVARQPRNPDGTPARLHWNDSHALETDPMRVGEKGRGRERGIGKRTKRWKRVKEILEIIMATWAVYNAVRYFLAFSIYTRDASMGQEVCFALGTSSGLSCASWLCSLILSIVKRKLLLRGLPFKHLDHICSSLPYLSSICLLGPAAANLAILFVWKNSTNPRYDLQRRCHVDIDVIWSASTHLCDEKFPSTAVWIILSSLRLAVTLIIIVAYHAISLLQPHYPHRPIHHRQRSEPPIPTTPMGGASSSAMMLPPNHDLRAQHQISDATLNATFQGDELSRPPSRLRLARSRSSGLSADTSNEPISFGRSALPDVDSEHDLIGHMDRFRSLVMQLTQETEDALEFAQADDTSSTEDPRESDPAGLPPAYSEDERDYETDGPTQGSPDNIFNLPPVPAALGYNEFGMPYPPDQDVHILNGYIRRMPTIESMGSGELGTSIGASSHRAGSSSSRPPTRNTLLSFTSNELEWTGSQPPSRANSLSVRAELLAGMSNINGASEHGELQSRSDIALRRVSSPTSFLESPLMGGHWDAYSTGSHSTTVSYHTATMGSFGDSYPPGPSGSRKNEPSS